MERGEFAFRGHEDHEMEEYDSDIEFRDALRETDLEEHQGIATPEKYGEEFNGFHEIVSEVAREGETCCCCFDDDEMNDYDAIEE